ncbi:MAG: bifunctional methylenetetrahydrofolate dehydrogenase/methenyltetrahydrofolate cyclohydrolase FolD [Candidatus Theseobacter exili]|nr:bifunctional methylenetetrahydrofolate dehydrogenase/methenyltetrahydrofolate cyclohydrolase FolD [Candidatus Theseobacter exili]
MSSQIIDGKKISAEIRDEIAKDVQILKDNTGHVPGLAVILVGDDPASQVYVRMKKKACEKANIASFEYRMPADTKECELLKKIEELNENDKVNGILVQLPLPGQIDENKVIRTVSPLKDVDGLHPENLGLLLSGRPRFVSCTPYGIQELLMRSGCSPEGKNVVIVGRSNLVGKPLAAILMQKSAGANATVTVAHSRTRNLKEITVGADILVSAIGRPGFITSDMVSEGAVVIDVGINRIDDSTLEKGYRIVGDVEYDTVSRKVSFITPVPGGVGPMTIAMLLKNTVKSSKMKWA